MAEKTYNTVVGGQEGEEIQTFQTAPCSYKEIISGPKDTSGHLVEQLVVMSLKAKIILGLC